MAMVAAAGGLLPPAAGALLQEVIDVLAIGIALRAVLPGRCTRSPMTPADDRHRARAAGWSTTPVPPSSSRSGPWPTRCRHGDGDWPRRTRLLARLESGLSRTSGPRRGCSCRSWPGCSGGADPTAAMSRTHAEIEHQVGRLRRLLADLDDDSVRARGRGRAAAPALRPVRGAAPAQRPGGGERLRLVPTDSAPRTTRAR